MKLWESVPKDYRVTEAMISYAAHSLWQLHSPRFTLSSAFAEEHLTRISEAQAWVDKIVRAYKHPPCRAAVRWRYPMPEVPHETYYLPCQRPSVEHGLCGIHLSPHEKDVRDRNLYGDVIAVQPSRMAIAMMEYQYNGTEEDE